MGTTEDLLKEFAQYDTTDSLLSEFSQYDKPAASQVGPYREGFVPPPSAPVDERLTPAGMKRQVTYAKVKDPSNLSPVPTFWDKVKAAADPNEMARDATYGAANMGDQYLLGAPSLVGDLANQATEAISGEQYFPTREQRTAYADEKRREAKIIHPYMPSGHDVAGLAGSVNSAIGGPAKAISGAIAPAASFAGRLAAGAATGAALGSLSPEGDIATNTAVGGLAGGFLPSAAEAAGGVWNKIRDSAGGKARALIEKLGGKVSPLTPGKGGPFDNELAGLKPDDRGIGTAGRQSAERILGGMDDAYEREVMAPHVQNKATISSSPAGQELVDSRPIIAELEGLVSSNKILPAEKSVINQLLDEYAPYNKQLGERTAKLMTQSEMNDFRAALARTTNPAGQTQTVPQSAMGNVFGAAKEIVDEGPYAATNAAFSRGKSEYESARNMLGLPKKAPENPRIATEEGLSEQEVNRLGNRLARQEQNTVTSGVQDAEALPRFVEEYPQYARDVELPNALRAQGDLSFKMAPQGSGGLMSRIKSASVGPGMFGAGVGGITGSPMTGAKAAAAAYALQQNAPAITGRLMYTPAREAALAAEGMANSPARIPFLEALQRAASDKSTSKAAREKAKKEYNLAKKAMLDREQEIRAGRILR